MKKFFTLTLALLASFSLWAADFTPTAVYTVGDAETLGTNFKTGLNQIANYFEVEDTVLFSPYVLYSSAAKNYQEWTGCAGSGSSGTTWNAITGRCFKGSAGMFSSSAKLATINSSRTYYYNVTNCAQVMGLVKSSNSITITFGAYVITGGEVATTPEKTATYKNGSFGIISLEGLDPEKTYQIKVSSDNSSNASFAEIAFVSPAKVQTCPSGLSISGTKAYTEGAKIELTAALEEGNGNITYQWYKGGKAEGNKLTGKTAAKLEIANCTGSDAGDYYCVASKADCADASNTEAYAVTVKTIEPTGDATITYALSGSTVTGTAAGVNSISSLSTSLTLSTLTLSGTKDGYSGAIKGCDASTEVNEDIYVDLQFTVANGYAFTPSAVSVKANPLSATGALKAVVKVMDATNTVASNELSCAKNTDNEAVFADGAFTGKLFEGTIHIRMYFYGAASDKAFYLKSPITVEGTVSVAPTKYNVNFAAGEGSGTMSTLKYVAGAEVTLPECTFTEPDGKEFDAWTSSDVTISDNKFTMPAKDVTITATWKTAVTRYTVTYKDGESTLGTEEVEENGHPAEYAQYQNKSLYSFGGWYDNSGLTGDAIDLSAATITEDITYYANFEKVYATSINIEQIVLDEGTKYNLMGYMGSINYASNIENSLDTLNDLEDKTNRNYAYLGLKVKSAGKLLNFRLAEGKTVKVKFGAYPSDNNKKPQVSINGADYAAMTITDGVYSYTATGDDLISIKTATGDAVIFKQIMIDEEIKDVVLPAPSAYKITLNAGAHGTLAASWEGKTDKKVNVPVDATVTLTVTPESGYKIASVKYNDGEDHVIEPVESVYSFTMPAAAVTVSATFSVATALDNTDVNAKAVKTLKNGVLIIEKNGKKYNIIGAEIR